MSMEYMPEGLRMNSPDNRAAYANLSAIREAVNGSGFWRPGAGLRPLTTCW